MPVHLSQVGDRLKKSTTNQAMLNYKADRFTHMVIYLI